MATRSLNQLAPIMAKKTKVDPPALPIADVPELVLTSDLILKTARAFFPWAVAAVLFAFVIGYGIGPYLRQRAGGSSVTVAIPPLPVVEPLTLRRVSMEEARKINLATPLTTSQIPAAAPFFLFTKGPDYERALDCLAATVYYEAAAEAVEGQMAVIQVVLNRARHPAYPKSICGVVFQGHERRTGCQFSYTCDGSMARRPNPQLWARFRGLARAMTNGMVYAPVGLATHYHTDWVLPAWSARLDKVRVERTHLFFRYHGYWGSPKAFAGRYTGAEPVFPKLGVLSLAHRTVDSPKLEDLKPEDTAVAAATVAPDIEQLSVTPERIAATIEPENNGKDVFLIYVDPLLDSEALRGMAKNACGTLKKCKVLAWADQGLMPRGLPLEPSDRSSMAFSYIRDGKDKAKWNCGLFPRENKAECL